MKKPAPLDPGLPVDDLGARRAFHAGHTGHMSHMSHLGGPGCAPARSATATATRRRFAR